MATKVRVLAVADLHQVESLYALLSKAVENHKPDIAALVGDFLDATGDTAGRLSIEECARTLSRLQCAEVVFVCGNHEDSSSWTFADEWRRLGRDFHLLEGACFTYGPLVLVGFPCLMLQGSGVGAELPADPKKWLPKLLRPHLPAARALWLMHEPPQGTPLSLDSGPISGNPEWRLAIERFLPKVVIFGHDHRTPRKTKRWHCQIGATTCLNVGQTDTGPLHYSVVEMTFPKSQQSLPESIVITAYPKGESFVPT